MWRVKLFYEYFGELEDMRQSITEPEIKKLMNDQILGTLIVVDKGKPYAVETSFATDD